MKKLDLFLTKKIQAAIPGLVYQCIYTTDNASNSGTSFYIKEITRKRMTSTTLKVFYILNFKPMNYLLSVLSHNPQAQKASKQYPKKYLGGDSHFFYAGVNRSKCGNWNR
jgi:hypothetical protein